MKIKETLIAVAVAGVLVATPVVASAKTAPLKDGKPAAATSPVAQPPQGSAATAAKTAAPAKAPLYPESKPLTPVTLRGAGAVK